MSKRSHASSIVCRLSMLLHWSDWQDDVLLAQGNKGAVQNQDSAWSALREQLLDEEHTVSWEEVSIVKLYCNWRLRRLLDAYSDWSNEPCLGILVFSYPGITALFPTAIKIMMQTAPHLIHDFPCCLHFYDWWFISCSVILFPFFSVTGSYPIIATEEVAPNFMCSNHQFSHCHW